MTDASPLPSFADLRERAVVVTLPLRVRFRGLDAREALLIEGPAGWTEFSPFIEYGDDEASTWLEAALDYGWHELPEQRRTDIMVNATIPAVPAASVPEILARFPGCRTAKIKVAEPGQRLADDVERVRAVRHELGAEGRIRVDANGGWNVDEAEHAVHALAEFDLEYIEQPCTTIDELVQLRERIRYLDIPIAADESVRKAEDPIAVARAGAADLLVIKAQPLGGIRRALDIVERAGLPVVVSSALDTAIGLSMGVALAAALPDLDYDCGLGTSALFETDVAVLEQNAGSIAIGRIRPDADAIERLAAAPERRDWWLARLERCLAVLREREDR